MKFDLNSSLKDKRVLYVVLFLAVTNLFGFLMARNFNAVVIFLLVGFIATYFSRNMIVILMIAIVVTNIVSGVKIIKEGMENNEDKEKKEKKDDSEESSSDKKEEKMTTLSPASYDDEKKAKKKPKVDYAGTLEAAYDNLDNLLSSDALKNMTNDTQRLAEKQKLLMGNIKKLEPMMQKATAMLDGLDMPGMQGMIQSLSKNMMSMSGDSKDKKSSDE